MKIEKMATCIKEGTNRYIFLIMMHYILVLCLDAYILKKFWIFHETKKLRLPMQNISGWGQEHGATYPT